MKRNPKSFLPFLFLALALLVGIALRCVWPLDIEMKFDEAETFNYLRDWSRGQLSFPWLGQPSSNGLRHPGLGIWIFLLLGKLFSVQTLPDLARIPPMLAILNFFMLVGFAWLAMRGRQRMNMLWAVGLMAVNPFLVLLDRKLWHPSVMGIFVSGFFLAWMKRGSRLGSFLLGIFFLLPGQIHMSGFFLTLGFFLFDLFYNRREFLPAIRRPFFGAGLAVGFIPMLPWIHWLLREAGRDGSISSTWARLFSFKFPNYWFSNAYGVLGPYPFGNAVFKSPIYAVLAGALLLLAIAGGVMFFRRAWRFFRRRQRGSSTQLEVFAGAGTGLIATLSLMHIPRYFTLCLGFAPYLSAVRSMSLYRHGRTWLGVLIVLQAAASFFLLSYIHFMPYPADNNLERYGVFGVPARECGNCKGNLKFERINGGEEIIHTK